MAYDPTLPLNDGYLADAPAELRELFRALKEDKIVNAGKLNGYTQGNANGNIPLNNGTLNTNLNADMLDGHDSAYFSASTHGHDAATADAAGFMSATDKTKLNGIATGAEVNQNAFSNVTVGSSTIQADGKTDTLTLAAGTGITLTADTTNDKVTIKVTDNTYAAASHQHNDYFPKSGGAISGTNIVRNSDAGWFWINGGSGWCLGGQIMMYGEQYSDEGLRGVVRIRAVGTDLGDKSLYCYPDGQLTWNGTIQATRFIGNADTASKLGTSNVGSATKPVYLNAGVATACTYELKKTVPSDAVFTDTVYTHPTTAGNKHIPAGGSSGQILKWGAAGTATWATPTDSGAMPKPTTSNVVRWTRKTSITLPSGGTWLWFVGTGTSDTDYYNFPSSHGISAGGTTISDYNGNNSGFGIRIA